MDAETKALWDMGVQAMREQAEAARLPLPEATKMYDALIVAEERLEKIGCECDGDVDAPHTCAWHEVKRALGDWS